MAKGVSEAVTSAELLDNLKTAGDGAELIINGVRFIKHGDYLTVEGSTSALLKLGIMKKQIHIDELSNYPELADLFHSSTSFKVNFKSSFDAPGVLLDVIGVAANTAYEMSQYDDPKDRAIVGTYTAATGAISTVASAAASAGAKFAVAKIAASIGTAISPGVGTLIGLGAGWFAGWVADKVFDWAQDKYIDPIVENN